MASIETTETRRDQIPKSFAELRERKPASSERFDCSVVATAVAADISYDKAEAFFYCRGYDLHIKIPHEATEDVLRDLGKSTVKVTTRFVREFKARMREEKNYMSPYVTTSQMAMFSDLLPKGIYLVNTGDHILTVKDGVVEDWSKDSPRRVIEVHRVE